MQSFPEPQERAVYAGAQLHHGVAKFMNGVYGWMSVGLAVTAAVSLLVAQSPAAVAMIYGTPLRWVAFLGPLAFVWFLAAKVHTMDRPLALGCFLAYAAMLGVALAYVPLVYSAVSILGIFVVTAAMFAGLALFGWTTKKDLTGWGSFLFMAVIGIVIAAVVNMFVMSSALGFGISAIAVLVFAGLTAYDTQKLKQLYLMHGGAGNLAILGALELYLDFLNLFLSLLRLFGSRDD